MPRTVDWRGAALVYGLAMSCSSGGDVPDATVLAPPPPPVAAAPGTTPAPAAPAGGKAPGPGVVQVRFDRITVKAGGDKALVKRGVRAHMSEIRACYNQGLARVPRLHGQIEVGLAIRKGGRVASASNRGSTLNDRTMASCVVRAARRWSFRGAKKRTDAVVRFKFYRG